MTNVKKNWKLWEGADIVVFQETFLEEKRRKRGMVTLDKKFEWFGKAAVRKYAKGRASGGQLIGVKKRLEASWKQTEWEYGLQLEIKRKDFKSLLEGEEYIEEADEKKREEQAHEWTYEDNINRKVSSGYDEKGNEGKEERSEKILEEDDLSKPLEQEEIIARISKLKKGKAAGGDGIAAEFLVGMPREGIEELIQLIKVMWQKNQIIKRWRTASIYTIHKKGDENLTGNYRGISLLDKVKVPFMEHP